MDIYCPKCGEPWDYPFDDAMTPDEIRRFKRGEGCPSCHWGTLCTNCHGTGKSSDYHAHCPDCRGSRYLIIRSIPGHPRHGSWVHNYDPNTKPWLHGDPLDPSNPYYIDVAEEYLCRDGWVTALMVRCPTCISTAADCPSCHGTGRLTTKRPERAALSALLMDVLGDDLDGVAAELDDAESLGLI